MSDTAMSELLTASPDFVDLGAERTHELDRRHVFHSWSAQASLDPMVITRAEGSHIWDGAGNRLLDFTSQLVFTNLGHQHPRIVAAIQEQAAHLCTVAPQHANAARSEAARLISTHTPGDLDRVFFTNGGADANEHAVRMARLHTGPAQGAVDVPLLPRRHPARDQHDRRPAAVGQRPGVGRDGPLLRAVPLPQPLPRHHERGGVRAGAGAPRPGHRPRGALDDRGGRARVHPRHRRDHGPAGRLPRRGARAVRPARHPAGRRRGDVRLRPGRPVVRLRATTGSCPTC